MSEAVILALTLRAPRPLSPEAVARWEAVVGAVLPDDVAPIIFLGELLGLLAGHPRPVFTATAYTDVDGFGGCDQRWSLTAGQITLQRDLAREINESWQHLDEFSDSVNIRGLSDGVFLEWGGGVTRGLAITVGNVPGDMEAGILSLARGLFEQVACQRGPGSTRARVRAERRREHCNVGYSGPTGGAMSGEEIAETALALTDEDDDVALGAVERLDAGDLMSRPDVLPGVAGALARGSSAVRTAIAKRMARSGRREYVQPLIGALQDRDGRVREEAVLALGDIGDASAIPAAAACLSDAGEHVRWYALVALGKLAADADWPAVKGPVLARLQDESHYVRGVAVSMVADRADTSVRKPLIDATRDRSDWVRREAVRGLRKLRDRRSVPALIKLLKDDDHTLRGMAAKALAEIGDPRAIEPLRDALRRAGEDQQLREATSAALEALQQADGTHGRQKP